MKIITSSNDDFLYYRLIKLLNDVKLVRGGTDLAYTLRNHKKIRDYLKDKQQTALFKIEEDFFHPDGSLDIEAIEGELESLQKNNHSVY